MIRMINVPLSNILGTSTRLLRKKSVDEALKLAKEYITISEDKINIIKHCCTLISNYGLKRELMSTLTIPRVHWTGQAI